MKKSARTIYVIFGIVLPILIGSLHTYTHLSQLISPEVQALLSKSIPINGQLQTLWNTWGIMSFMMGIAFIVIGLLNFVIFSGIAKEDYPPILGILTMMGYLCCVIYVGNEFEQLPQFYGGIVGLLFMGGCLGLTIKGQ